MPDLFPDDAGAAVVPQDDRAPRHRRPLWMLALAALLGLVLAGVAAVGGFLLFLNETVGSNITREDLLPTPSATVQNPTSPSPGSSTQPAATGGGSNILIIGSDARPGETASRSDVIVLVHVPRDAGKVYLVHFPRDLYVSIPGHGKDKINAAYAYGGAPLLVQTLQDMLGVKIDHVAKTDFEGFKKMTDAVGGVRVYAEEASNGTGNGGPTVIHQGWNDLNGQQALDFVRERYLLSEGDISRGRRQQAFIKALLLKATGRSVLTNPLTLARFADAASSDLVVDRGFTMSVMRGYALELRNVRSGDVVFVTAPFTGFGTAPNGGSIDIVDQPGMENLGDMLRNDTMGDYGDVSVIP